MRLAATMTEVAGALQAITKLRVFDYPPKTITPPTGYVSYPIEIVYDETYGRGQDQVTDLAIVLLSADVTTRTARETVSAWSAGDGPLSVKARLEAWAWQTCDDLTVTSCAFDIEKIAGISYLAAIFKATAVGAGKED